MSLVNRWETIESVLLLTRAERSSRGGALNDIRLVREQLESTLGGTVRPSEAAQLLGVSRPSIKRWLDSDDIPTVLTRGGRREIPISELVDLLLETEEMRQAGRERVLGAVIRARRERAGEIDVDALLPPRRPRTHRQAELQSLAYHRLVADRLTPEVVAGALRNVDRWESAGQLDPRWASEWRRLLDLSPFEIQRALRSDSKHARELRQTSPFVGVVTEQERRRIIEAVEARR